MCRLGKVRRPRVAVIPLPRIAPCLRVAWSSSNNYVDLSINFCQFLPQTKVRQVQHQDLNSLLPQWLY